MKKIVSLLLVLALAFACVSFASADDITGEWVLTEASSSGVSFDPGMLGLEMSAVINGDGTFVLTAYGESTNGTWTMNGNTITLTVDNSPLDFVYDGTSLVAEQDGVSLKFTRKGAEAPKAAAPATVYVTDISAFNGSWKATKISYNGFELDAAMLASFGMDQATLDAMSFIIDNGLATSVAGGDAMQFSLVDGLLFAEQGGQSMRIQLLEGDALSLDISMFEGLSFILTRAEAAQAAA